MSAYCFFDSGYAPCGFLIVKEGKDPYSDDPSDTVLVQSDWDWPIVASRMGWTPCKCGATDGTIDCPHRTASDMVSEAYDYIRDNEGELFDELMDYFET